MGLVAVLIWSVFQNRDLCRERSVAGWSVENGNAERRNIELTDSFALACVIAKIINNSNENICRE